MTCIKPAFKKKGFWLPMESTIKPAIKVLELVVAKQHGLSYCCIALSQSWVWGFQNLETLGRSDIICPGGWCVCPRLSGPKVSAPVREFGFWTPGFWRV